MKYEDNWYFKWHKKSPSEALKTLESDQRHGLTSEDVTKRLGLYGRNKLDEGKKTNIAMHFLSQFNDFMILILLAAAGLSFGMSVMRGEHDLLDPIIILLIVLVNATLGVIQENKAEKALEALKNMSAPHARVRRDSKIAHIPAEELVPGDIILLESGDYVPADARLLTAVNLKVEESALTGESAPVEKDASLVINDDCPIGDRRNMVFSAGVCTYGRAEAVVVDTGMCTEVGKIAKMIISDESPQTPLQKRLSETGKLLGIGALLICALIFALGVGQVPPFEMFMTSISLAVAAIPEGLPAIVTIMLSIGVTRMAGKNAIIRKLPAVETLGSATVICSDKTGTLTQNKMKVVEIADCNKTVAQSSPMAAHILRIATLCNDSILTNGEDGYSSIGDPTETALVIAAANRGIDKNKLEAAFVREAEVPFDSARKLMTTIHKREGVDKYIVYTKGAVDVLLERCKYVYNGTEVRLMTAEKRKEIMEQNGKMADKALRVLGVAYGEQESLPKKIESDSIETELVFCGMIGMIDPPREEAREAVAICRRAGIKPVMITGDHKRTAIAIAQKIGVMEDELVMTGRELDNLSQEDLCRDINNYAVFARVSPEHKVRIVKAFQANGEVVAMTGDGVNDAPALKIADIGCAMGISGTDVAKGAADMVLTDDNFATIVQAVREGRGIYANIKKAVQFLLSSNIGEIITIFIAVLLRWPPPLLAIQLLWVNLVTDSLPAIALGVDGIDPEIMEQKPIQGKKSLFSDGLGVTIGLQGLMIGLLALIAFGIGNVYFGQESPIIGRTMAFAVLSISQLVHAFNMRSTKSVFSKHILDNKYLVGAFFIGLSLQILVIMIPTIATVFKVTPLMLDHWLIVAALSLLPLVIVEFEKLLQRQRRIPEVC